MTEDEFVLFINQKIIEIGDAMMAYYDCCHIDGSSCKAGNPNPCCLGPTIFGSGKCSFLVNGECCFPNCNCKLWICNTAIESTDPKGVEALKTLERFAEVYGLVRKPFIGQPYVGADRK